MDRTSRQYAYKMLQNEIKRLKAIKKMKESGKSEEEIEASENYRDILAVTELKEITIQLSTGGPADGFKLYVNDNNEIVRAVYFWAWGCYHEIELNQEEIDLLASEYEHLIYC